ncbi:hypothetical protein P7K49_028880 [Saguinus oedipus]|uniref:Serine-threonine kinase receptor-associated protein n=1 Tax=Saguinus oedipus TaxID=9490 RepID=A0ABQ9U5M3_SAGOE|nr:hypothetical protein P7K49_028880 [Saguinus oedipus]
MQFRPVRLQRKQGILVQSWLTLRYDCVKTKSHKPIFVGQAPDSGTSPTPACHTWNQCPFRLQEVLDEDEGLACLQEGHTTYTSCHRIALLFLFPSPTPVSGWGPEGARGAAAEERKDNNDSKLASVDAGFTRAGAPLNKEATKAATAAADFRAKVWDAVSGDELMTSVLNTLLRLWISQDSHYLLTVGQDKLLRMYDLNKPEADPKEMSGCTPHEYIPEGEISVVTYVRCIVFHSAVSLDPLKPFEAPATINSAPLHPEKEFLVAGGEDFKLYKYDHNSREELESYKGHFSPIHCVRFSPDGEFCACGSEDGILGLWQTLIGKTYDLEMYAS